MYTRRNGGGPMRGRLGNDAFAGPRSPQPKSIFEVVRRQRLEYMNMEKEPYGEAMPGPSYESEFYSRRPHPYDMPPRRQPSIPPNGIPSLLEVQPEIQPAPLLPPESVEKLRAKLRSSGFRFNEELQEWEDERGGNFSDTKRLIDQFDVSTFMKEEKATKKKIDEIIRVAQVLREKLEKEEELRQALEAIDKSHEREDDDDIDHRRSSRIDPAETRTDPYESGPDHYEPGEGHFEPRDDHYEPDVGPYGPRENIYETRSPPPKSIHSDNPDRIPSLFEIKPKIPSLFDVCVPPPDFMQDNLQMTIHNNRYEQDFEPTKCWNCNRFGHIYTECRLPRMRKFCFRCGTPDYDVHSCPCIYDRSQIYY